MNEFLNPKSMTEPGVDVFRWKPQDGNVTHRFQEGWTNRGAGQSGLQADRDPAWNSRGHDICIINPSIQRMPSRGPLIIS
jgi:hypothetical protein